MISPNEVIPDDVETDDVSVFDGEVDVDDKPQRVWPLVAALVALGLVFGGIAVAVVTAGTPVAAFVVDLVTPGDPTSVVSTQTIEETMDITLAPGARSEPPREKSAYMVGQVSFDGTVDEAFTGIGYVELFDVPPGRIRDWNDELDNPRYFVTGDGRAALVGTFDGNTVAVFTQQ